MTDLHDVTLGYVILFVPSVADALSFYEAAFGLKRRMLHEGGDYGELETGSTRLAFTSHALGAQVVPIPYTPATPQGAPPGFELTLTMADVDQAWARALEAGATALSEPHDMPWGQRVAYVRDRHGVIVGLASPMP